MGDMLSQAEIDALLGGGSSDDNSESTESSEDNIIDKSSELDRLLTAEQKDVLGEIGNISMGTSATTLFALLGQKVLITTPKVKVMSWKTISEGYQRPCVGIRVNYVEGIEGANVLVLKETDVKIISSLMLGGNGVDGVEGPINEIDLSAIGEAMNQMVGSSSTSLSSLIKMKIDIDTPKAFLLDFNDDDFLNNIGLNDEPVVCTSFRMEIGSLIDSEIMQIVPYEFAMKMVDIMKDEFSWGETEKAPEPKQITPTPPPPPLPTPAAPEPVQGNQQIDQQGYPPAQPAYPPYGGSPMPQQSFVPPPAQDRYVNVQPAQFQSFDMSSAIQQKENIGIIMDVPLEISVELGRTVKSIKEILEFSPGTIIELDKLAGEPIDVLVNGKFIAKGEVVVIEENFCIRITDIISVENRI